MTELVQHPAGKIAARVDKNLQVVNNLRELGINTAGKAASRVGQKSSWQEGAAALADVQLVQAGKETSW